MATARSTHNVLEVVCSDSPAWRDQGPSRMEHTMKVAALALLVTLFFASTSIAQQGSALSFDGTDDRVTVPYDTSFPTEVFTASAWIKLAQPAGRAAIIARGEDDNSFNLSWQLYVTRDGALEVMLEDSNERNYCYPLNNCAPMGTCTVTGGLFVADDDWHHVAVARDASGALALYIDGERRAGCEGTGVPSSNNFQDLSIGCTFGTIGPPPGGIEPPTWFFPGLIDAPAMWNVALSETQIAAVFGGGIDPLSAALVGYWAFDEGTGQAVADLSPAGNNGFLGATPDVDSADPLWVSTPVSAELVLINGNILTMDDDESIVSAVRIVDGRFVAVGDSMGEIDPSAQVIDLNGRTVTPGLIDSHIHYFRDSHVPGYIFSDIETTFTIAALLDALTERTTSVPAGEFITAFGRLRPAQFAENRLPTLAELDSAAPNHPVYLHVSFDGPAVTNTLGKTFFEARGVSVNQSGTFNRGQAAPAVQALFGEYTNDDALRTVREYMQFSASLGLTTIQNFSGCGGFGGRVGPDILCEGNYFDLWQQGELRVRVRTAAGATGTNTDAAGIYQIVPNTEAALQELQNLGGGDDWLDFTTTGEFVVGRFGDTGAPFASAYLQIAERGWSLRQHSISNAENNAHISAFETVNTTVPIADLRWALEHVFSISNNDINRLKAIGAGVTVQNQQYMIGRSGPPYRNLVDSGVPISGGTDASAISPMSPWISIYHMVTGRVASGAVMNAGQQISRMEALRLYTRGSAWHTFDDEVLGSIEVGKLADLVVLSDDYLSVPEDEIRTLSSVLTLIDGRIVHAAAEFSDSVGLDVAFLPGDSNAGGTGDISDGLAILDTLFLK